MNKALTSRPLEANSRSAERPRQYPRDRFCPECQKRLSVFNRGPLCYTCEEKLVQETPVEKLVLERW